METLRIKLNRNGLGATVERQEPVAVKALLKYDEYNSPELVVLGVPFGGPISGRDVDGEVRRWGRNSRLDNIQAAILSHKLKTYDDVIKRRREVAQMYQDRLGSLEELQLPAAPSMESDNFDVYQNYELTADNRDELRANLSKKNIGTLIQWGGTAVHQFTQLGFNQVLPDTERFFERCIMLPMNVFISDSDVDYICEGVTDFYRK